LRRFDASPFSLVPRDLGTNWGRHRPYIAFASLIDHGLPLVRSSAEANVIASLELRSERYRIVYRFAGKKFQTPIKTTEEKEAQGCLAPHRTVAKSGSCRRRAVSRPLSSRLRWGARHGLQTAREGEAPAEPRAREILDFGRVSCRFRLGRSLALPKQATQTMWCARFGEDVRRRSVLATCAKTAETDMRSQEDRQQKWFQGNVFVNMPRDSEAICASASRNSRCRPCRARTGGHPRPGSQANARRRLSSSCWAASSAGRVA